MTTSARPRYPFPIPFGWFQICWPDELAVGQVKPLYYFARHLVAWRDEAGAAHLMDAFCPHLGAHLGHGGTVRDCRIVCPFHGWAYDAEGANVDIPYAEKPNRSAQIRTYPVIERNGLTMAWYHPTDEAPRWEIPEIAEFNGDPEFSEPIRTHYTIAAAWQEMAENSVDSAHFRYVHNTASVPEIDSYETDGPRSAMRSSQKFPTPRGVVEGRIDSDACGPGFSTTWFRGIVDTLLIGTNTPIDAEHCELRFNFTVRNIGDAETTSTVGQAFVAEVDRQVREDTPIWEHKAHLVRPALATGDGPFTKFRTWARQFYAEPVSDERTVYPPPYWPDKIDETPAKATASARLGQD